MSSHKRISVSGILLAALLGLIFLFSACTPEGSDIPADTVPSELPCFYVNTKDGAEITSKEEYLTCSVTVDYEDTQYGFGNAPAKIRGRGNSSWYEMPKKSYRLKFDEKTDLFGNGSAKTWTLIANYCDPSLARNYFAYSLGSLFETQIYTTSTQFVQLYLNGTYNGVYLVCEQVQTGKNRVDIDEGIDDADTGYLLELDVRIEGEPGYDYVSTYDSHFKWRNYQIKSPDVEDVEKAKGDQYMFADYIGMYLYESYYSLIDREPYETVCERIDVESFAESYILNELFHSQDVGDSSFFLYKKKGGKLYSGPIWDYDISMGNCNYPSSFYTKDVSSNPNCLWAKELNPWYYYLLRYKEFKVLVAQKLAYYAAKVTEKLNACVEYLFEREKEFEKNFEKWDILGTYVWPNPDDMVRLKSWRAHVSYARDWLKKSLKYIRTVYQTSE